MPPTGMSNISYIEAAKAKGYDVLLMDGQLDTHFLNHLEPKLKESRFARVDSDIVEKLIVKEESRESKLSSAPAGRPDPGLPGPPTRTGDDLPGKL